MPSPETSAFLSISDSFEEEIEISSNSEGEECRVRDILGWWISDDGRELEFIVLFEGTDGHRWEPWTSLCAWDGDDWCLTDRFVTYLRQKPKALVDLNRFAMEQRGAPVVLPVEEELGQKRKRRNLHVWPRPSKKQRSH